MIIDSIDGSLREKKIEHQKNKVEKIQKQSSLSKYQSKNFATIKTFFTEEFNCQINSKNEISLSKNLLLHQGPALSSVGLAVIPLFCRSLCRRNANFCDYYLSKTAE